MILDQFSLSGKVAMVTGCSSGLGEGMALGLAEAGAGDADQRAVMQVILNRVRHPAFTNTVCGVIFQGSERSTGCQFTFTCDGSLRRTYPDSLWRAARQRAEEMLGGAVFQPVGNATHYHTNWVYPWWSPKLDKIAQVKTHLFFRWRGFWGSRNALSARYAGGEPDPAALRQRANAAKGAGLPLAMLNSNKRAITLNLKTERGKQLLKEMVAKADVLLENFTPDVMTKLGVGWEVLRQVNPRLIYASGSGYGLSGPNRDAMAMGPDDDDDADDNDDE